MNGFALLIMLKYLEASKLNPYIIFDSEDEYGSIIYKLTNKIDFELIVSDELEFYVSKTHFIDYVSIYCKQTHNKYKRMVSCE